MPLIAMLQSCEFVFSCSSIDSLFSFVQRSTWFCDQILHRGRYLGFGGQQHADLLHQGPDILPQLYPHAKKKSCHSLEGLLSDRFSELYFTKLRFLQHLQQVVFFSILFQRIDNVRVGSKYSYVRVLFFCSFSDSWTCRFCSVRVNFSVASYFKFVQETLRVVRTL